MPVSFLEVEPRSFKPVSVPGLTNEAREATNAALKAMSTWRNEMADTSEKNGKQVIESMAGLPQRWDGQSKSLMLLAHRCGASPKCRSKRWIA